MSLVVLEDVGLDFGARSIFDGASFRIAATDRIGLVGPNGSGKTTLLRMIAREQQPDRGALHESRHLRLGYLPQELNVESGRTLISLVLSSVPGRDELTNEIGICEKELSDPDIDEEALINLGERVAELHEKLEHFERFYSKHEALRILAGLGFAPGDEERDIGEFSGGWRMRGILASILFQRPDLMLLDEPTNHLDLPTVSWFSNFLKNYTQSFVLISHDREFLNEQINRVVSLESEGVRSYSGNYEKYVSQRAMEEEVLEAKAKNLAREREHMEKFVNRFRAQATKAAAVQSRVKALEKMEDVELYQKRRVMRFRFPPSERAANEVIKVDSLGKAYGENQVFSGVNVAARRGEKIAIIGANGAGKTTLLKILAGELKASAGEFRLGNKVRLGYYAQHHADSLHKDSTAYQEVSNANPDATVGQVRSILGAFLFSGDDVDKKVSVLSGGERARVALAKLLIKPGNVILMDEPTNHLDLDSSDSLASSLSEYDGTLLFVSHNRAFIRKLATQMWNVEDGRVEPYPGSLDEYLYSCSQRGEDVSEAVQSRGNGKSSELKKRGSREEQKARKREEAQKRKLRNAKLKPAKDLVAKLEERVSTLEAKQADRSKQLSDPSVYADASKRDVLLADFEKSQSKLDELNSRWEHAVEELERIQAELGETD